VNTPSPLKAGLNFCEQVYLFFGEEIERLKTIKSFCESAVYIHQGSCAREESNKMKIN
jgi:hypothetical protein